MARSSRKLAVSSVDPVNVSRRIIRTPRATPALVASSEPRVRSLGDAYIGLDASLTGYGVVVLFSDEQHLDKLIKTAPDEDVYAYRLKYIKDVLVESLRALQENYTVKAIFMERPAYAASGAFTGGLVHAATALALLEVFDGTTLVKPDLVATNTLKKFVTGKGTGPKSVIIKGVYKKWGYDTDDDNLADAYGLARMAAAVTCGTSELAYERDCIATVLKRRTPWEPPQQPQKSDSPQSSSRNSSRSPRSKAPATASKRTPPRRRSSGSRTTPTSSS